MANRAERRAHKRADWMLQNNQSQTAVAAVAASDNTVTAAPATEAPVLTMAAAAAAGAASPIPTVTVPENDDSRPRKINVSPAKLAANRANAQHSHGPVTPAGKQKSSMNAVKTGLTGRTVLLPSDDVAIYQAHLDRHFHELSPQDDGERVLAQLIADSEWRLLRIAPLEEAIWAHGYYSLSHLFPEVTDEITREHLIRVEILKEYQKQFANLAIQESRLNRQIQKHTSELHRRQEIRRLNEKSDLDKASVLCRDAIQQGKPINLHEFGFDFSKAELLHYLTVTDPQFQALGTRPPFRKVLNEYRAAQKIAAGGR